SSLPGRQLKAWLDPDNTGNKKIEGTDGKVFPKANFTSIPELPCTEAPVILKNLSKNNPRQYRWQITPSSFEFLPDSNQQMTTDTSPNPVIKFLEARQYTIRLITSNPFGTDTFTQVITAGNIQTSFIQFPTDSPLCGKMVKDLQLEASGAYSFDFTFDTSRYLYSQQGNRLYLTLKDTSINDSTFTDTIRVIASHGQCQYTVEKLLTVYNIPYDRIRNALPIHLGKNGPFDNTCASYEAGEPHPDDGGCAVPDNWCYNASNPDTVVFRSLWFTFTSPASGFINIQTQGLDTRLALYEANAAADLLSNNYRLVAAVDNTPSDIQATLSNINVLSGKRYWLQVDANADAKGTFTINLFSKDIEISPNPANQWVKITIPAPTNGSGILSIISTDGKLYLKENFNASPENNLIWVDCSWMPPGLYIVRYSSTFGTFATKLLIWHP
ncbi:MAG: T9SS type A sorting domain-containing protein, partial [Bacteroidales bacterium]